MAAVSTGDLLCLSKYISNGEDQDAAREREVYRYYRPLEDILEAPEAPPDRAENASGGAIISRRYSCKDQALNAFTQLGALRLDCRRALVSLFDRSNQYILSEATKTLSLPKNTVEDATDDLCFGVTTFKRFGTPGELAAGLLVARDMDKVSSQGDVVVVPDLSLDDRFSDKPFVQSGARGRFYAGVPIVSPNNYTIGSYCIMDDKPRAGLLPSEVAFMRDMAVTIMSHLETIRTGSDLRRSQHMVSGLGDFISGRSILKGPWRSAGSDLNKGRDVSRRSNGSSPRTRSSSAPSFQDDKKDSITTRQCSSSVLEMVKETANSDEEKPPPQRPFPRGSPTGLKAESHQLPLPSPASRKESSKTSDVQESSLPTDILDTFKRAVSIVREAVDLDGAMFLDASVNTFAGLVGKGSEHSGPSVTSMGGSQTSTIRPGQTPTEYAAEQEKPCLVFGLSLLKKPNESEEVRQPLPITERFLHSLLERYPKGKIWTFDGDDKDTKEGVTSASNVGAHEGVNRRGPRWWERRMIQDTFPGVRSIAFAGLWDSHRGRWFAGSLLWTCSPTRTLSPEGELNYLVAFGQSIMAEVASLDVKMADKAKATFISSISHELRTPLHGILGSSECLQTTNLEKYQSDLVYTIDTCGKTLLDTFDNLLSYAKINFMTAAPGKRNPSAGQGTNDASKGSSSVSESNIHLGSLIEEVVDTVFAGQEFIRTGPIKPPEADLGAFAVRSHSQATIKGRGLDGINVSVRYASPDSSQWVFRIQPGAWRRIVLNLVGNALKYTERGSVSVRVETVLIPGEEDSRVELRLLVSDTGRGMSEEFQRSSLFKPFVQEDSLSPGTGLGLNIVKQIVTSMDGRISVSSRKGEGTDISVSVPVHCGTKVTKASSLSNISEKCKGVHLKILEHAITSSGPNDTVWTFADICKQSFGLAVNFDSVPGEMNIYIATERYIRSSAGKRFSRHSRSSREGKSALIVLCKDSASVGASRKLGIAAQLSSYVDYISQPWGPTRVARTLAPCLAYLHGAHSRTRSLKSPARDLITRVFPGVPETRSSPASPLSLPGSAPGFLSDSSFQHPTSPWTPISDSIPAFWVSRPHDAELEGNVAAVSIESSQEAHQHAATLPSEPTPSKEKLKPDPTMASAAPITSQVVASIPHQTVVSPTTDAVPAIQINLPPRPTVLIVDDNSVNTHLMATFMTKLKRLYSTASNGLEAFETYKAAKPDGETQALQAMNRFSAYEVIFMDINMPVMDGLESTRQIRAYERKFRLKPARIIAITGDASATTQQESYASGVDVFLTKPVRLKEVSRTLDNRESSGG